MLVTVLGLVLIVAGVIVFYFRWSYEYWKRKNAPYLVPAAPFGTMTNVFLSKICFGQLLQQQYRQGKEMGHVGLGLFQLTTPNYLVIDPEHVKNICTKDFNHFVDHGVYYNERDDPLSAHLFALEGERWRNLRVKLSPIFTSGKIKMMFPLVVRIGKELKKFVDEICASRKPFEAKELAGCFTTDVVGACGFGLDCNSFKDPNCEFRRHTSKVFKYESWDALRSIVGHANPELARFLGIRAIAPRDSEFFMNIIEKTVELRNTRGIRRNDFIQLLIDLNANSEEKSILTFEELAAQAFLFFFAGYESSSITLSFCLYELALHPHIQDQIRNEIQSVLKDDEVSYERLSEMKYLEQVVEETLRKYPPLPALNRKCTRDYLVPDTDITIEKGTQVIISTMGLHYDEEYFPDPQKFDPDRFGNKNKSKIRSFTYLPFGDGPRICTGIRFALMQIKIALIVLLRDYKFSLNEKTVLPIVLEPTAFFLTTKDGIWLDVEKI